MATFNHSRAARLCLSVYKKEIIHLKSSRSLTLSSNLRNEDRGKTTDAIDSTQINAEEDDFRVFEIEGLKKAVTARRAERWSKPPPPPRYSSMPTDQDWTDIWPTATTFKWSAVPFPVRQGYVENSSENEGVIPSKYANLELMKGPNFLHLTPAHVKKHCKAIKHFCTKWPEGLETDEQCHKHFPLESVTSDYVFAGPSLTDDRARLATIQFKLSDLELDYHAKDKFIRLVGERYNAETDEVVFESNRCPLKTQNLEYIKFLLTAVYFESWKTEPWEQRKQLSDMETYVWDINKSKETCLTLLATIKAKSAENGDGGLNYLPESVEDAEVVCHLPEVQQYKTAVENLFNDGENEDTLNSYKAAVEKLLQFKTAV